MDSLWYWKKFESTGNVADYLEYLKHLGDEEFQEEDNEDVDGWAGNMGEEDW